MYRFNWVTISAGVPPDHLGTKIMRERADLIEARRERDQAVARAHAIGRLHAADAG